MSTSSSFSRGWFFASLGAFVLLELFFGGFIGGALAGRYVSQMLLYQLQVALFLGAVFAGGLGIGLVSTSVRTWEPAAAAFVSVGLTLLIAVFLPNVWLQFSIGKWLIGGSIAAACAFSGARLGERFMGRIHDDGTPRKRATAPSVVGSGASSAVAAPTERQLASELTALKQRM